MKFSDMPYLRPELSAMTEKMKELTASFNSAGTFEEAEKVFIAKDVFSRHVDTLINLVYIRHSIDTRDAFYDAEQQYWNEASPALQEYEQQWTQALLNSPFRAELEEKYGNLLFINAEIFMKAFSPEIIPLMQQENDLAQKYEKLLASAQIPFENGVYTLSQLSPYKNDANDTIRLAAWKAEGAWYKQHQEELDDIYDKLVALRTQMAQRLGYEDFTTLGYYRMQRNCYTKSDVAEFRKAVRQYLVPLAEKVFRQQAKRLKVGYPMNFADAALMFRSGNPKPQGNADEIVAHAKAFYDMLSPETSAFFRKMLEDELMSLLSTEGKAAGGYCTSLHDYEVPFIFANFNGTRDDVETVTHEAGHAFAGWYNRKRVPMETVWPSLEACEVHSMSMEFFSWLAADTFFGKDAEKFKYAHLAGSLTFIPYGTMVDHFQHIVFEQPDLSPARRHEEWKRLLGVYMPWLRLDGEIPFYSEGMGWQRQHHIYSSPFYYIDYCLAQTVALSFWSMIQDDSRNAWAHYIAYTKQGGSVTFTELLKNADLQSPFDPENLRCICEKAAAWLDQFPVDTLK